MNSSLINIQSTRGNELLEACFKLFLFLTNFPDKKYSNAKKNGNLWVTGRKSMVDEVAFLTSINFVFQGLAVIMQKIIHEVDMT